MGTQVVLVRNDDEPEAEGGGRGGQEGSEQQSMKKAFHAWIGREAGKMLLNNERK